MTDASLLPVVSCRGLTKVFKDFWLRPRVTAVEGLDLEVRPREVFGLLGPNGSGKSTTIKILLGLLYPTRGLASVFGKLPTDVATKARVGFLPEESYLYRFLDARETLDYYGRLFCLERRTRRKRIEMLLEMVGLEGAQRRPVGEYSKGMQRRIGLAQALINDPDLLILDEPTTGLDPLGTRQIKDLILRLRDRGKTVLLCSHLLADVEDVCDRITVLYGGRVRALGTVGELLTVADATLIETDALRPQTVEKVRALILAEERKAIRKVEAPRKKLETLFLEIVQRAQAEGVQTSGARTGGALAEFLAAGAPTASEEEGRALIDRLGAPIPSAAPVSKPPAAPASGEPDAALLRRLTEPGAEAQPAVRPAPGSGAPATKELGAAQQAPEASPAKPPPAVDQAVIQKLLDKDGSS